jgi:hypothetical protein
LAISREALQNLGGALWAWMECKAGFATRKPGLWAKNPTPQIATLQDATPVKAKLFSARSWVFYGAGFIQTC